MDIIAGARRARLRFARAGSPGRLNRSARYQCLSAALAAAILTLSLPLIASAQDAHVGNLSGRASNGKQLFRRYCIGCHGVNGDGMGDNEPWVDPKPRDFTLGVFKCRSTPTGNLPVDQDIFDTIGRGLNTTAMPSWAPLTKQERVDLVAYIKTFSPRFKTEKSDPPIPTSPETPNTEASIARGETLYQVSLKCYQCHGATGNADGPSASTLRDDKDRPIVPYNFNVGSRLKCGSTNADLYRIFMTGLDGTPMPSYADYLKPDQAWDLVHYLRKLQHQRTAKSEPAAPALTASK